MQSPKEIYLKRVQQGEIKHDPGQQIAVRALDALYQELTSVQSATRWYKDIFSARKSLSKGFYIWGGVGTGKTLLMDIFYHALPQGLGKRIHFHRFMQSVHDQKSEIKDQQDPLAIIAKHYASKQSVLCLDEFSVTDIADAMILSGLFGHLFERGVCLVTTSNTPIDDLYKNGLQRTRFLPAIELLKKHTSSIKVDSGNDYRMAYLQDGNAFHTPCGAMADAQLKSCFHQLTMGYEEAIKIIEINGRQIAALNAAPGVVWFEFDDICRSNRSNSDFIEIARQFHTVIISNIHQLDATMDDAARRFIELVDELYDRNVNLVVSSDQIPGQIYVGKRLADPYKRTASRLIEMGSNDYIAKPHLS